MYGVVYAVGGLSVSAPCKPTSSGGQALVYHGFVQRVRKYGVYGSVRPVYGGLVVGTGRCTTGVRRVVGTGRCTTGVRQCTEVCTDGVPRGVRQCTVYGRCSTVYGRCTVLTYLIY